MATCRRWTLGSGAMALAAATAALMAGCFVGSSSSSSSGSAPSSGGGVGYASSSGGGPSGQPMLVVVDTGGVFNPPQPGQGVGVFTEYQAGGHWHVSWTCDTSVTGLDCPFTIAVSVNQGTIANVTNQLSSTGSQLSQPSAVELSASTTTTTAADGVLFDTLPGATITLEVQVNGADNGAFLFFVQEHAVNGGYKGTLTDPLMLQPSTP